MDSLHSDTIVAPITGNGPAAVAVIRLSGSNSFEIASKIFSPWPSEVTPRYALVGRYGFGESGIALPFASGASFTGQESVELSLHGGRASISALLDACIENGARLALPGEFTLRAFLNSRIDLSQAEAIADIVESQTSRQLRLANLNLKGELKKSIETVVDAVAEELVRLEASIDFSDEIGEFDFVAAERSYDSIFQELSEICEKGRRAHFSRLGIRIAIIGKPNAGKSSLFNRLLGIDRAIVTAIPGTTRDTIEESVDWGGVKVVLIDTAGIREVNEQIERLGIARTLDSAKSADQVFYLYDSEAGWTDDDANIVAGLATAPIIIGNKADLVRPTVGIAVSSMTGEGVDTLYREIHSRHGEVEEFMPINDRQAAHLTSALESLHEAAKSAASLQPPDLLSIFLNEVLDSLGKVLGTTASPDMLAEIFSRFCIGK